MDIKTILQKTGGGRAIFEDHYGLPLNEKTLSPLNTSDTNPGFIIYWCKTSEKFKYCDYGEGDIKGDAIDFVCAMENINTEEAIEFITKIIIPKMENTPIDGVTHTRMVSDNEAARTNQSNNSSNAKLSLAEEQRQKIAQMAAKINARPEPVKVDFPEGEYMVFNPPNYFGSEHLTYMSRSIATDVKPLLDRYDVKCVKEARYPVSNGGLTEIRNIYSQLKPIRYSCIRSELRSGNATHHYLQISVTNTCMWVKEKWTIHSYSDRIKWM